VHDLAVDPFETLLEPHAWRDLRVALERAAEGMAGRTLWCVNSTASGGGVAEMLPPLLGYLRGAGVDARWTVIEGDDRFFEITKRLHNMLHGDVGDGEGLGPDDRRAYEACLAPSVSDLRERLGGGDVVVLHDPQPAGLVPAVAPLAGRTVWRCHVGVDDPNDVVRSAWDFLHPYVAAADACVFSRDAYVWPSLDRTAVIPPSIDPFSAKNRDLERPTADALLVASGVQDGPDGDATFERPDGGRDRVRRRATMVEEHRLTPETAIVTQVSRWDRLKDPAGVVRGFADHVPAETGAELVLAGPEVDGVGDDPEQREVAEEVRRAVEELPRSRRRRVHLAFVPVEDPVENAIVVNALQRRSDVVVQKSVAEGFGLTVAEAMWKERPVVASSVGGIADQIEDGRSGRLVGDPRDGAAFGRAVTDLLRDRDTAVALGRAARARVRDRFLPDRHLRRWVDLVGRLASGEPTRGAG